MADEALYRAKAQGRNRVICEMTLANGVDVKQRLHTLVPLVWKDAFLCGNKSIDAQHKVLVQIANKLFSAMIPEGPDADVARIVVNLLAEAAQHFHDEEALLRQLRFDKLDQHAAGHAQLLAEADRLVGEFELKKLTLASLFQFLAHDVIIRHMLDSDREYFSLIANPVPPVAVN